MRRPKILIVVVVLVTLIYSMLDITNNRSRRGPLSTIKDLPKSETVERYEIHQDSHNNNQLSCNNTKAKKSHNSEMSTASREVKVERLVTILAGLTHIPPGDEIMSAMRRHLLTLPDVPSLPPDVVQKSKDSPMSTAVPPMVTITYKSTFHGFNLPVLTGEQEGRLGNVMGHYATMYALNKLYNASMVITSEMREQLKHFPHVSLPVLPVQYNRDFWQKLSYVGNMHSINYTPLQLAAAGLLGPQQFVIADYPFETQLFHTFKKELREEFVFSSHITAEATNFLQSVLESRKTEGFPEVIFIGFHVRLTDYVQHIQSYGAQVPADIYYYRATNYYRTRYPNSAVFIVASDDVEFLKAKFEDSSDVFFAPGTSPELDMAILTSCNHSIITVGTYGFWSGFLANGEVVYPDIKYKIDYSFSRKIFERIGLQSFTPLPVD